MLLINSCCMLNILNNYNTRYDNFINYLRNEYISHNTLIIYNKNNISSCEPVDYFERDISDTTYIIFSEKNYENKIVRLLCCK